MIIQNQRFFLHCMEQAIIQNNNFTDKRSTNVDEYFVRSVTGPYLLSKVLDDYKNTEVKLLPKEYFNPLLDHRGDDYYTRHIMTGHWGIEVIEENKKNNKKRFENLPFDEFFHLMILCCPFDILCPFDDFVVSLMTLFLSL